MAFGLGTRAGSTTVRLVADTGQFNRDINHAESNFRRSSRGMEGDISRLSRGTLAGSGAFSHLGRSIAFASSTFLGAAGFTTLVRSSIAAASDLHEQINKVNVVFRGSQKGVLDWSETTAKGLGIARGQALAFAGTFGNLLVPMGIGRGEAAKMSVQFVQLAADMASFNNASPEDTLRALQSGLAGQVRPLRQFGIFLDQNRIKAEALRLGLLKGNVDLKQVGVLNEQVAVAQAKYNKALKEYGPHSTQAVSAHVALEKANGALGKATSGVTGQLTQQQKVLATTSIIMRDSKDAQGDFARTSGGLANQQRILRAEITNLEEKIGTALLPTVLKITHSLTNWLGKTKNQQTVQRDLNAVLRVAGQFMGAVRDAADALWPVVKKVTDMVGGTKNAFKLLIGLAVVAKINNITGSLIGAKGTGGLVGALVRADTSAGGLKTKLMGLSRLGAISIPVSILIGSVVVQPYVTKFLNNLFSKIGLGTDPNATGPFGPKGSGGPVVDPHTGKLVWPSGAPYKEGQKKDPGTLGGGKSGTSAQQDANARKGVSTGAEAGVVQTAVAASQSRGAGSTSFHLPGEATPYDCSAFVAAVFAKSGIHLPGAPRSTTYTIASGGRKVARNDVLPGDLLLFDISGDVQPAPNHVGIYVSANAMVHDHGAHGGVSYQGVPWGALWGVRCYIQSHKHGVPTASGSKPKADTGTTPPASGDDTSTGGLVVGTKAKTKKAPKADLPDIPYTLQEKLARAELTKGLNDDLKVLTEIEDYLEKRIAKTKNIKRRVSLLKELGSIKSQIARITEKLPKTQGGFIQTGGSPGLGLAPVSAPTAKPGQKEINIPGIGKILVGTEQAPTLDQIRSTIVEVYNKITAAIARRDAKKKALAKLLKVRQPNARQKAAIKRLQNDINKLNKLIEDLKADLGQYIGAANDLAAEMASEAETKAGESEGSPGSGPEDSGAADAGAAPGITDIPVGLSYGLASAQYAGDIGGQQAALRAEEGLLESRLSQTKSLDQRIELMGAISSIRDQLASVATATPLDLQLAQAQARLTPSPLDDRQLTQQFKTLIEARLKEANTIQEQINLTNQLADLKGQLNQEQADENAQIEAYINARRELVRTFASNVLSRTLAGSQLTLQMLTQPLSSDPHVFSSQVMFELGALMS